MKKSIGPILLIIIGIVLLLSNLNILPMGELKALFKQWWPILLIIIGVIQLRGAR